MTLTYGFYDSISLDRLYNAKQMGSIFDGLILDGVYPNYGDHFEVLEDTGMNVSVGTGRTWFDHTWSYNDALISKTIPTADAILDRIDIVYLEINEEVATRANSVGVLEGTPASTPVPPTLTNTSTIHQYALAHIYVAASVTEILQADITDMVGTVDTPFVELVTISEDMQAQIYAIVGDTNPPLIDLIDLKAHKHDVDTPQIEAGGLAADAVETAKIKNLNVTSDKLASKAVITTKIDDDAVDDVKVGDRVPALTKRQGGDAADWSIFGTTTYTPGAVRIQCGVSRWTGSSSTTGQKGVTFPTAFSNKPVVFVTAFNSDPHNVLSVVPGGYTANGFNWAWETFDAVGITSLDVFWFAIGPE